MLVKKFQKDGLSKEEAYKRCWMFDVNGLLVKSRTDLADHQKPFAHESEPSNDFAASILKDKTNCNYWCKYSWRSFHSTGN